MPRLRRSRPDLPGISRKGAGRGFRYLTPDGAAVTDQETLERVCSLAIPSAWRDVWIAPGATEHIQAIGTDAAGRRQYLYHPQWRAARDLEKFDRALALAARLPAARRLVTRDLRRPGLTQARVLAAAFRLLDRGCLRVGNEEYAAAYGSFGLATLRVRHVSLVGAGVIRLRFPAKSRQTWTSEIEDAELCAALAPLLERPRTGRLFAWQDEDGRWRPISADLINADVGRRTGLDATAKDFRTLCGTVVAATELAAQGPQASEAARTRVIALAMRAAAKELGNTPAVARASYVDPRVVEAFRRDEVIEQRPRLSAEAALRALLMS